jgi:hypothetical protein
MTTRAITTGRGLLFTAAMTSWFVLLWSCHCNRLNPLRIHTGKIFATAGRRAGHVGRTEPGDTVVRKGLAVWVTLALVVSVATFALGFTVGHANTHDEAIMTVQVSSADHEVLEGYFTLGDNATVMVKPGSDLYKFLSRQRGRKVKVVLTEVKGPELSRLQR